MLKNLKKPDIYLWTYDKSKPIESFYSTYGKVPLKPFVGTIGLALKEKGNHSVVPPRHCGGNLDIKELSKGYILGIGSGARREEIVRVLKREDLLSYFEEIDYQIKVHFFDIYS